MYFGFNNCETINETFYYFNQTETQYDMVLITLINGLWITFYGVEGQANVEIFSKIKGKLHQSPLRIIVMTSH